MNPSGINKISLLILIVGSFVTGLQAQEVLRVRSGGVLTVRNGAILSLSGGITLEDGSQLVNDGTIILRQNGGSGAADWIDHAVTPYSYGAGTFMFTSTGNQTLNSRNTLERIEVNSGGINLASDISSNNWYLIRGKVNTGVFKAIALSTSSSSVQADPSNAVFSNSWINGTLRRYIAPTSVMSYDFPIGDSISSHRAVLESISANPMKNIRYLDIFFSGKQGTDAGMAISEYSSAYTGVNGKGVWHIQPDAKPTEGKYDLLLYFTGFNNLADDQFAILERPDSSASGKDWKVPPASWLPPAGAAGRIVSGGYARRNSLLGFGQFGIGMTSSALNAGGGPQLVVLIYPNPSRGSFTLRLDGTDKPYKAWLLDAAGRKIRTIEGVGNQNITVSGLRPGLYFLFIPDSFDIGRSFVGRVLVI